MLNRCFSCFLILLLLPGCRYFDSRDTAEAQAGDASPLYSEWNDRALLLAGLPVSAQYSARPEVAALLSRPSTIAHQRMMDNLWKSVEDRRIRRIVPWREKYLDNRVRSKTALYPLSGGDFLSLNLMFPNADRYIMIAMEKPGNIPDPIKMNEWQLRHGLVAVEQMLGNIVQTGYFWSHLMRTYMNAESYGFYGTLPTVSVFLVRLGHSIRDVQRVCINEAGRLDIIGDETTAGCHVPGYRIRFRDGRTGTSKELIYLSTKIDDNLFAPGTTGKSFFSEIQHSAVMLKAAVYLLHSPSAQSVADYLLNTADVVLQDDSGLPYRTFEPSKWDVELYGAYVAPPRLDIDYYPQPDLARAFREGARELPFDFGYGQIEPTKRSGIIVAFKKETGR